VDASEASVVGGSRPLRPSATRTRPTLLAPRPEGWQRLRGDTRGGRGWASRGSEAVEDDTAEPATRDPFYKFPAKRRPQEEASHPNPRLHPEDMGYSLSMSSMRLAVPGI
jgi:hypothetical protein